MEMRFSNGNEEFCHDTLSKINLSLKDLSEMPNEQIKDVIELLSIRKTVE